MADARDRLIEVEVVYALPQMQTVVTLKMPAGSSIREAIARSGVVARHPEVDWNSMPVGIFGKLAPLSTVLHEHDRVEIYRPLSADSKQARRKRAQRTVKGKR